jgi:predicted site-specific integrase-resolvase
MALTDIGEQEVFYTLTRVAEVLDVSRATIARWKKDGKLPKPVTVNGMERYSSRDLERFINQQNPHRKQVSSLEGEAAAVVQGA